MAVIRSIVRPVIRPVIRNITGTTDPFAAFNILYDENSFVGNPVERINNLGTAGTDFDCDLVNGTAANLTIVQENGVDCVNFGGDVRISTSVDATITGIGTWFMVVKMADIVGPDVLVDNSGPVDQHFVRLEANSNYRFDAGIPSEIGGGSGMDLALLVVNWNQDPTSRMQVFGTMPGNSTADVGANDLIGMTLFADRNLQASTATGIFCMGGYIDREMTDSEIFDLKIFVGDKYGIIYL